MNLKKAQKLIADGALKKGCRVKMRAFWNNRFVEIDGAYVRPAREGEMEDDWAVVVIEGKEYDVFWIDAIEPPNEASHSKEIEFLAMSIVNFTNESNDVAVKTRQEHNDACFDFAIEKIKEFIQRNKGDV